MKPRERVLRAFNRKEGLPDRVPVQFDLCKQHLEYFSKKLDIPINYTNNFYEDITYRISGNEIRLAMGSDVVITGAGESSDFEPKKFDDGTWLNEYNMRMRQGSIYVEVVEYPLADAETVEDIKKYNFPDPHAEGRYKDAKELVDKYKDDYLIIGDIELTIMSLAQQLVGMEKLMIDMAMKKDYLDYLIEKCTDFQIEVSLRLIEAGVDAIWVGDDFGSQRSLLFSEEMFRDLYKPHYIRLIESIKDAKADIIPILHSDGAVKDLLNDLSEIGFEVFNPVQPNVKGHEPHALKNEFGDKFAFWGAIDQQDLLPNGNDEQVKKDVQEKINILGENGGYMIAPAHIIQSDVSPDRVEKFINYCKKYGKYQN